MPIIGSLSASPQQNGTDLQSALNSAVPGSIIQLAAGAQFLGPFVFPKISGASASAPITVQTTALASLPAAGQRITPAYVSFLPQLQYPSQGGSSGPQPYSNPYTNCGCLNFADGAAYWILIGLEVMCTFNNPWSYFQLVLVGNNSQNALNAPTVGGNGQNITFSQGQTSLSQVPSNITLDRLYIHGPPNLVAGYNSGGANLSQLKGGVEFHCNTGTIQGCYISGIMGNGFETHGIFCGNGPGNYQILNNYVEASCENFFCGGVYPALGTVMAQGPDAL